MSTCNRNVKEFMRWLIIALLLSSCSAHYHVMRAMKKGYSCDETSDTIQVSTIDSIPYVLRDSIYWHKVIVQKDTIVRYKVSKVPVTRFQERIRYKYKTKYIKAEAQKVKYQNKYITKTKVNWLFVIIAFILGILVKFTLNETFRSRLRLLTKL